MSRSKRKVRNKIRRSVVSHDPDAILLGDFNTMGRDDSAESSTEERAAVEQGVAGEAPGFGLLPVEPSCSEYYQGNADLLDLILFGDDMREAVSPPSRLTGYCALANCDRIGDDMPPAYDGLSDHCPIVFSIESRDLV